MSAPRLRAVPPRRVSASRLWRAVEPEIARLEEQFGYENAGRRKSGVVLLAARAGVERKIVHRLKVSRQVEEPTAERILAALGWCLADVFDEYAGDVELEPDAYCPSCDGRRFEGRVIDGMVTPIRGICPWCETPVVPLRELAVAA